MRGYRDLRRATALAAASAVLALILPFDPLRVLVALPLLFFLPGYAIAAATFARGRIPLPQMLVLSVGLSLAVLALGALVLNYLPGGIRAGWWALLLFAVVLGACRAAAVRRPRRRQASRPSSLPRPSLAQGGMLAGGALAIVAAIVLAYVPLGAANAVGYTEMWIRPLHSARAGVEIGVGSGEQEDVPYRLFVKFGDGEPPQGRKFTLAPGETRAVRLLTEGEPQAAKPIEAALFREDQPGSGAYRRVSSWIGPGTSGE
jgi:Protein of unknown function (DUF1616)